ncbi:MAG: hypothetical protein ACLFPA_12565, partial [Dichotomicrobium sp.]
MSEPTDEMIDYCDLPAAEIAAVAITNCKHAPHCDCEVGDDGRIIYCEPIYELVCRVLWELKGVMQAPDVPEGRGNGVSEGEGSGEADKGG